MQGKRSTLSLFLLWLIPSVVLAQPLTEQQALELGTQAYIYAYPLITMDLTEQVMTNVAAPNGKYSPIGQFTHLRSYPTPTFKEVTTPNADTLYSVAWLDIAKEPTVLHVPNENGRYYLLPMLSAWTNVFAAPGTRTTGTKAQDFVIIGPQWKGKLPAGLTVIQAPTNMVWIIGRTYCTGSPEDYKAVHALQDQYQLTPLSYYGKPYTPHDGPVNANIDMNTPVRDQVNALDAAHYFKRLATLLKNNPPAKTDAAMVTILQQLGIVPGKEFDLTQSNPAIAKGLQQAVHAGQEKIMNQLKQADVQKNGWYFATKTGHYGNDYLQRAYIAAIGLGANLVQDAIYALTTTDQSGKTLNGANRYFIHFSKGQTPPVNGFWSLTLYNKQFFFVDNALNRYSLSPRNHLIYNPDGSLDLYIQHDSPGKEKESNWLPAPSGDFVLLFRFYWPKVALITGAWLPPGILVSTI